MSLLYHTDLGETYYLIDIHLLGYKNSHQKFYDLLDSNKYVIQNMLHVQVS